MRCSPSHRNVSLVAVLIDHNRFAVFPRVQTHRGVVARFRSKALKGDVLEDDMSDPLLRVVVEPAAAAVNSAKVSIGI